MQGICGKFELRWVVKEALEFVKAKVCSRTVGKLPFGMISALLVEFPTVK